MAKPVCVVIGIGPKNGQAFASRFAKEGYAVALFSRSTDYSSGLAKELGGKAYACDVTDPAAIKNAFAQVRNDLGDVDVLLYNAGSGQFGTFENVPDEEFEKGWQINVRGLLQSTREVVGSMRERGKGTIIVTGATASLRGKPFTAAFASAKAAQRSLAQSFARQLGPEGIHVALVIVDGGIGTDEQTGDEGTHLRPSDIAETVYHLATQPKSAWSFEVDVRPFKETW
ncbi:MAG: SDR family NAD(P)-dependent oxidoreductase [Myxococcales bacterium]|nr:SDR family NAD(P)-dependent oxidoreductase [Myxococcales bacterium]MDH3843234.1 SDR family NAD(P)-dependent oxidoreductase [Myxococcales bacterium]